MNDRRHPARDTRETRSTPTHSLALTYGHELTIKQQAREIERLRAANLALVGIVSTINIH